MDNISVCDRGLPYMRVLAYFLEDAGDVFTTKRLEKTVCHYVASLELNFTFMTSSTHSLLEEI